ncbi:MAG TPA: glycosyltransferase family 2 protein [Gaiellaceae bacterium]|jgi:glycosyltransferase involved in cell wall biosynthesis
MPTYSVVIPARNAEETLGRVLEALAVQEPRPEEVIVVDDASTDGTAALAERLGATVVRLEEPLRAGGARNRGWEEARGDAVVFLDADAVPGPGWASGVQRALEEFPEAVVASARTFTARTRWGWVSHLELETPFLPQGEPREQPTLSSFCMAVPRWAPLRWHESYGGEDGLFSVDALDAGLKLVFDPRFHAIHDHRRESFGDLRRQQRRVVYGFARARRLLDEPFYRRLSPRFPLHYFALLRLPVIYRRIRHDPDLSSRFVRLLPWLVVGEWMLGLSASRYVFGAPGPRDTQREFR